MIHVTTKNGQSGHTTDCSGDLAAQGVSDPRERLAFAPDGAQQKHAPMSTASGDRREDFAGSAETEQSIPERFAQVAARHGNRIAIGASTAQWTYAELDQRSDALAAQILERLEAKSEPVVLLMQHAAGLVAAILGVLKAGKIYLALDPSHSAERLSAMLADSRARLLIADQTNAALANSLASGQLSILTIADDVAAPSTPTNLPEVAPEAGAWLMYTSGSTGTPKGVWQNHRGIVHDADVYGDLIHLTPNDRLSLLTSCSLVASSTALFGALLSGATLCPFHVRSQGAERLAIWLREQGITVYHSVPAVFRHLVRATDDDSMFANLRLIRLGGESVLRADLEVFRQRFADHCRLMNSLSSTETGLICAGLFDKHTALPDWRVPVGRPVRDLEVLLVNEQGQSVENGCDGRIAVRSAYLRQGYWLRPEATAEKFQTDSRAPGTRLFITNDLGRFLPDGHLEHLGRMDRVVKIRGLRTDLSEVEATLRATDLVEEAVVTALEDPSDGYRLVAHVVPRATTDYSPQACHRALQQLLPMPSRILMLRELPLLASGKIDRVQLTEKAAEALAPEASSRSDTSDPLELQLVRIWEKILKVDRIGMMDDFFVLGGDSLAATTMLAAVEKFLGANLPISVLLEAPTIQKLVELIKVGGLNETDLPLVALRLCGSKPPLYYVPGAGSDAIEPRVLARHLGEDQPVLAFHSPGLDGRSPYLRSVEEMAESYLKAMQLHQPHGPYCLSGASFGGVVAFEMARRLAAIGEEVRLLALLDSYGGKYPKRRRSLVPRKRLKLALLRFLPHGQPDSFALSSFKRGLKEWMKRFLIRRMISIDTLLNWRALRCPYKLRALYIQEVCIAARRRYQPGPFQGKIHLFRVEEQPPSDLFEPDPVLGWSGLAAGGIEVHELAGCHGIYLGEPNVADLARKLTACLEQARVEGAVQA